MPSMVSFKSRSKLSRETLLLALILLSGCSGSTKASYRVIGNGAHFSIFDVKNETEATPMADRHCQLYGKSARLREMSGDRAVFECVSE